MLKLQLIIKYVKLWQFPYGSTRLIIGLSIKKLCSIEHACYWSLSPLQLYYNQVAKALSASDIAAEHMDLGRWQPDFIVISYSSKKIALGPEVCRPSDTRAGTLAEVYDR